MLVKFRDLESKSSEIFSRAGNFSSLHIDKMAFSVGPFTTVNGEK